MSRAQTRELMSSSPMDPASLDPKTLCSCTSGQVTFPPSCSCWVKGEKSDTRLKRMQVLRADSSWWAVTVGLWKCHLECIFMYLCILSIFVVCVCVCVCVGVLPFFVSFLSRTTFDSCHCQPKFHIVTAYQPYIATGRLNQSGHMLHKVARWLRSNQLEVTNPLQFDSQGWILQTWKVGQCRSPGNRTQALGLSQSSWPTKNGQAPTQNWSCKSHHLTPLAGMLPSQNPPATTRAKQRKPRKRVWWNRIPISATPLRNFTPSPLCSFAFFLCQLVARMRRAAPHFALRTTPFGNAAMPHPAMNHHWMVHRKCHFFYCLLVKKKNSYNASWALNNHPDATPVAAPITQLPNSFGVLWIDLQRPIIAILEGLLAVKRSKLRKSDPSIIQGELSNNNQIKTNDTKYHIMCVKRTLFCVYI